MPLNLPNRFVNDTVADAVPVDDNYQRISQYINGQCITRDGATSMAAPLTLFADPTQPMHAATKQYVDATLPIGIMFPYGGDTSPDDAHWKICNGQQLSKTIYSALFDVIGYRYNEPAGDTGDLFMLPNMRRRLPIGRDDRTSGADTRFNATGDRGGSFSLPVVQHSHAMPHTHVMPHTHEHAHQHTMPHTHPIPHDHAATVSTSVRQSAASGTTNSFMPSGSDGTTRVVTNNPTVNISNAPSPGSSGNPSVGSTGAANDATTSQPSIASTGASSATRTANEGVTDEYVVPYMVFSYIIRVA